MYAAGTAHGRALAHWLISSWCSGWTPTSAGLVADVNVFGDGIVQLGTVRPEAAELLARLIAAGLAAESSDMTTKAPRLSLREAPAA